MVFVLFFQHFSFYFNMDKSWFRPFPVGLLSLSLSYTYFTRQQDKGRKRKQNKSNAFNANVWFAEIFIYVIKSIPISVFFFFFEMKCLYGITAEKCHRMKYQRKKYVNFPKQYEQKTEWKWECMEKLRCFTILTFATRNWKDWIEIETLW